MSRFPVQGRVLVLVGALALVAGGVYALRGLGGAAPEAADEPPPVDLALGEQRAREVCGSCHLQPPPDALTRGEWGFALSLMGLFTAQELGHGEETLHYRQLQEDGELRKRLGQLYRHLSALDQVAEAPMVSDAEWRSLRAWYLAEAPESRPEDDRPTWPEAEFLEPLDHAYDKAGGFTSLVRIVPDEGRLYVGDAGVGPDRKGPTLTELGADGSVGHTLPLPEAPLDLEVGPDAWRVTASAMFPDPDKPFPGTYASYPRDPEGVVRTVVGGMVRTVNIVPADLDGDGAEELVGSGFGFGMLRTGGVFVYRPDGEGGYEEALHWAFPGVLRVEVFDADADGHLDILALAAASREGLYLLRGPFTDAPAEVVPVVQRHPAYGFTHMAPADLDGDGRLDLVVVNGDNTDGDRTNTRRPYHGIRVLKNQGEGRFEEAFFHHLPGASMVTVDDFDGDGRLDLAVAAAYPDLTEDPVRSFVLLRGTGPFVFEPLSHPAAAVGRWITVDSGDLDGDGDPDLVLGGFQFPLGANRTSELAMAKLDRMNAEAPPVLILENTTR